MQISAEMVLNIAHLRQSSEQAERRLERVGGVGERAAARINRGFRRADIGAGPGRMSTYWRQAAGAARGFGAVAGGAVGGIVGTIDGLIRKFRTLAYVMAFAGAAAGTLLVADSAKLAARLEDTVLTAQVFAGSLERGAELMREIAQYSVETPFETSGLEDLATGLLSAGVEADNLMRTVRLLGGVAKDTESLVGLGDAFGKGFAKDKFDLEQINRFLERQINLLPALAQVRGTDTAGLTAQIRSGSITPDDMLAALEVMTSRGGQFFGLAERRSRTVLGLWSTLVSNVDNLRRIAFLPSLDAFREALNGLIAQSQRLVPLAESVGRSIALHLELAMAALNNWDGRQWMTVAVASARLIGAELINALVMAFAAGGIAAQRMVEHFATGLTGTAQFFRAAMSNTIEALGKGLAAALIRAAAVWAETIAKIPVLGDGMQPISDDLADWGRRMGGEAQAASFVSEQMWQAWRTSAKGNLGELIGVIGDDLAELAANWRSLAPLDTRSNEPLQAAWHDLMLHVGTTRLARQGPVPIDPRQPTGAGVDALDTEDPVSGDTVTRRASAPGRLAQAVNLLAGRNAGELIWTEAKTSNALLTRANALLGQISQKMDTPVTVPSPVGVFAAP